MRHTIYSLAILLMISAGLTARENNCNCLENLQKLVAKTEENYAGFPVKVNAATLPQYRQLKDSLEKVARNETNPKNCYYLLKNYVRFFKDKHFILSYANPDDYDSEIIEYSESYFREKLAKKQLAGVEGIWINADSSLKLAIQRFPGNIFKAIVLQAKDSAIPRGLVYLTLTPSKNGFIAREFNSFLTTDIPAKQKGNLLQIWNQSLFGKVYPTGLSESEMRELGTWLNNNNGLDFQQLSPKTAYLKIPTFLSNDEKIIRLISENDAVIRSCENLIVDLTGNGGGNTGWVSMLPYFMTNPIVQKSNFLRVSPENVKAKLNDLEPFVANPIPDEYKKYFPEEVVLAYKKAYRELAGTKEIFYPIPGVVFPLDSILPKPGRIALVVDDFTGSSAEYFFFLSGQSKKTITYGINTIGMMDYEGMSNPTALPYNHYFLTIPIVKLNWTDKKPIDQTGFQPDVLLNKIDRVKWIEHIRKELEDR